MKLHHALGVAMLLACTPAFAQQAESPWAETRLHPADVGAYRAVRGYRVHQPLDIRTPSQLVAVAQQYVGSRRFTRYARAWCADAMNAWLARAGYRGTGDGRAISFARYGRPTGPRVGSIAVMRHHVGIVVGYGSRGPILLSGNHARRVGVGEYSAHRIIAYREPV